MFWNLSQVDNLSPNADVNISSPVPVDSMLQNGTWYYRFELPGTYMFSDTGSYVIPIKNTYAGIENCNNTEDVSFSVEVKMTPKADFSFVHSGCIADSVHFNAPANTGNGYTIGSWSWTFPDGSTADVSDPTKLFTTTGAQDINLHVITTEGCVGDTIRTLDIFARPIVNFGADPVNICEGSGVSFTDTSSFNGTTGAIGWYWDFGNGTSLTSPNGDAQNVTYPGYGTYTVRHAVKVTEACISDTVEKVITVYAKPAINISFPDGCLPADGMIQFNNSSTTPDGQTLSHAWTFGDPNANSSNPNT
jgi:hypothetical protein